MHLEPNNERTPENQKRLKLKGFHKRKIIVKAIKNFFDFRPTKPGRKIVGSGSGGNGEVDGCFSYLIEEVKATGYNSRTGEAYKKTSGYQCRRQQLPGKLILIDKKYFRIL